MDSRRILSFSYELYIRRQVGYDIAGEFFSEVVLQRVCEILGDNRFHVVRHDCGECREFLSCLHLAGNDGRTVLEGKLEVFAARKHLDYNLRNSTDRLECVVVVVRGIRFLRNLLSENFSCGTFAFSALDSGERNTGYVF